MYPVHEAMTNDGAALFRAICEQPAEDTPRLVYADWLDENSQPDRAEFIRLQCEAWNLCPAYPMLTEARTRASVLQRQFGDQWYEELPIIPGVQWGALFVRGFVDAAEILALDDLPRAINGLFAAVPLRYLTVTSLRRRQLRQLLTCPFLVRLVSLRLPGTQGRGDAQLLTEAQKRFPRLEIY